MTEKIGAAERAAIADEAFDRGWSAGWTTGVIEGAYEAGKRTQFDKDQAEAIEDGINELVSAAK
jgi:hypothetical protein